MFPAIGCAAPATRPSDATGATRPATTRPATSRPSEEESAVRDYIEYRTQPELGTITIQTGSVRGAKRVAGFEKRAKDLPAKGIFPLLDEKRRIFRRRETLDNRRIDTLIVIDPPGEPVVAPDKPVDPRGEPDAAAEPTWTAHLLIRVDGRTKLACSIGISDDAELWIYRVTIYPEEGTLEVLALSADGQELALPAETLSLDDPTVIKDDSFFEENNDFDSRTPVKVKWVTDENCRLEVRQHTPE